MRNAFLRTKLKGINKRYYLQEIADIHLIEYLQSWDK